MIDVSLDTADYDMFVTNFAEITLALSRQADNLERIAQSLETLIQLKDKYG